MINPDKRKEYNRRYREKNKEKLREAQKLYLHKKPDYNKRYYSKHSERYSDAQLKRKYGIGLEEYNKLLASQGGKCLFCDKPPETGTKSLAVDHDHETGKVRGLLCESHNRGLGMFHDNINELERAILYLKSNDNL